jgi:serine/threonine protein phosphatase 1
MLRDTLFRTLASTLQSSSNLRSAMLSKVTLTKQETLCYPPAPDGTVLYAIGDIHGRVDCLRQAHGLIDRDIARRSAAEIVSEIYLGDYVDRGPNSKEVVDLLIARSLVARTQLLRGNHEVLMEAFLRQMIPFEEWRNVGGLETILSYGVDARTLLAKGAIHARDLAEKLPLTHLRFFSSLKYLHTEERYCFAHAGLKPGLPIDQQVVDDIVGIRNEFLNFPRDFGFIVVHGHTPVPDIDFLPNRINIDTGAYITNRLSVVRIDASGVLPLRDEFE